MVCSAGKFTSALAPGHPKSASPVTTLTASTSSRLHWSGRGVPALVPSSVYLRCRQGKTIETDVEICYPSGPRLELLQTSGLPSGWSVVLVGNSPNAVQADPFLSGASAIGKAVVRFKAVAPPAQGTSNLLALVAVRYGLERYELKLPVKIDVNDGIGAVPRNLLFTSDSLGRLLGLEPGLFCNPSAGTINSRW